MIYQIDDITLDPANFRVIQANQALDVEPKTFDLMIYLIEQRERVVTRDEILEKV